VPNELSFPVGGEVSNVTVVDCRLRALEEDASSRRPLYLAAFHAGPGARRVKLLNNDIYGSAAWGIGGVGPAVRAEIISNTFHGGAVNDVVTLNGSFSQTLIDANILTDTPGRIVLGMGRHNYIRFNEVHQASRGTWENAEEIYLVHGGVEASKTVSTATGGSAATLTDTKQNWKPGFHREATVLIISGRGFGQYRRVAENSATTLTVDQPWNVAPDASSEYLVAPQFVENAFFANLNNTPCRMSLWLDCIANQVEMHRDDHAKGTDLWGEDASAVDEKGIGRGLSKFFPAWYNTFVNCWMDGTALWLGTPGAHANNAHVGYPNFGNYVVRNRLRSPHSYRTGFDFVRPQAEAGINVGGGRGRAGTSHTIVSENFLASTYTGIRVADTARKTFLLRNEFDHVDEPVQDRGAGTVLEGNQRSDRRPKDPADAALANRRSERDLAEWQPKPWTADPAELLPPLFHDVLALKVMVSQPAYCFANEVQSEARQSECQSNLKRLFALLKQYDGKHDGLPKAAFYPRLPLTSADSLRVLLGDKETTRFTCPTCSPDLQRFGLNYAWNQKLSGKRLADIKEPANTWLLMDFVGAHDWMVNNGHCGHRRGVNILYADGSVKWSRPFSTEAWNTKAPQSWLTWAKE
jgi:prepilin-type processing-associated H-X9-DG protein